MLYIYYFKCKQCEFEYGKQRALTQAGLWNICSSWQVLRWPRVWICCAWMPHGYESTFRQNSGLIYCADWNACKRKKQTGFVPVRLFMFDTPAHSLLTPLRQSVIFNSTSVEGLVITLNLQLLPLQIYLASTSNDCFWNKRHVKQRGKVPFPPVMQSLAGDKPWPLTKRQVSRALQLAAGSNCQHWICIKTCCLLLWLYTGAVPDMKWNFTNWRKRDSAKRPSSQGPLKTPSLRPGVSHFTCLETGNG